MTSQGSAHARSRRAIAQSNLFNAELAAREKREPLALDDALDLVFLMATLATSSRFSALNSRVARSATKLVWVDVAGVQSAG